MLGSCASKDANIALNESGAGRTPASATVPAGPDGHSDSRGKDTRIGALANRDSDGMMPRDAGARTGCGSASLLRIDMGNGYSANDVLARIEQHGTFSGVTQIPVVGDYGYWMGQYATSVENDAKTLEPWLSGSAPGTSAEEVRAMAGNSEAYKYAVDFASGKGALHVYGNEYDMGHRMAAIMAVMFAASSQGDPDCAEYVQRVWVPKLTPNSNAGKMFGNLRIKEISALAKEGRLGKVFEETHANRIEIDEQIKLAKTELGFEEEKNKWELEKIKWELQESYQAINEELMNIPGCQHSTSLYNTLFAPKNGSRNHAQSAIAKCRQRVSEKLSNARMSQLKIQGNIKVYERRMSFEQERLERAKERDNDRDIERRERAIENYEKKIEGLKESNEKALVVTEKYQEAYELVSNPDTSSFTAELDRIRDLSGDKQKRESDGYFRQHRSAINSLEGRLDNTTNHYLTMGYMGGFERNN